MGMLEEKKSMTLLTSRMKRKDKGIAKYATKKKKEFELQTI
jgi:hypothetical protein